MYLRLGLKLQGEYGTPKLLFRADKETANPIILKSFIRDSGSCKPWIWNGKNRIRDKKHPGSTTLFGAHLPSVLGIRDVYPGSQIRVFSIPDPLDLGSEFFPSRIPTQNFFSNLGNMIRVVHRGSGSRIRNLIFYLSRIQGSNRHRIRIRNTAFPEVQALLNRWQRVCVLYTVVPRKALAWRGRLSTA